MKPLSLHISNVVLYTKNGLNHVLQPKVAQKKLKKGGFKDLTAL